MQDHHVLHGQSERPERVLVGLCWFRVTASPKYMGICHKRSVGVNCEGKHIILSVKSTKNANKPSKAVAKAHVKRAASVAKVVGIVWNGSRVGVSEQLPPHCGGYRCGSLQGPR